MPASESGRLIGGSADIGGRMERLPVSRFHVKLAASLGAATFFDGFDALTIAFVLPVLMREWGLTPSAAGLLVAAGYAGQAIGATAFGMLAQARGRQFTLILCTALFSLASAGCALAPSFALLIVARFIQGLGLGGEMPVAATYINEMVSSRKRAGVFFLYQGSFGLGVVAAALIGAHVVPAYGWRWMMWLGVLPLFVLPLVRRYCPETPLWLAARGRAADADRAMTRIEDETLRLGHDLPATPAAIDEEPAARGRLRDLFAPGRRKDAIGSCVMWMASTIVVYGLGVWLPTVLSGIYGLSVSTSLQLSSISSALVLAVPLAMAALSLWVGRKTLIVSGFLIAAALLGLLAVGTKPTVPMLMVVITIAGMAGAAVSATLYLYTPELFPTSLRALGAGVSSACQRIGAIVSPLVIGLLLDGGRVTTVFAFLTIIGAIGCAAGIILGRETSIRHARRKWAPNGE